MRHGLLDQVAAIVAEDPDVSTAQVQARVNARRADCVAALRTLRESQQPDQTRGTVPRRSDGRSRHLLTERKDAPNVKTTEQPPRWATFRDNFREIARLMEEPRIALVELLAGVQRSAELRPVDDLLYDLVGRRLAFDREFQAELEEVGRFYEMWLWFIAGGGTPDREFLETLARATPEEREELFASIERVDDEEPANNRASTPSAAVALPVPEPAVGPLSEPDPVDPLGLLGGDQIRSVRGLE